MADPVKKRLSDLPPVGVTPSYTVYNTDDPKQAVATRTEDFQELDPDKYPRSYSSSMQRRLARLSAGGNTNNGERRLRDTYLEHQNPFKGIKFERMDK